MMHKGWKHVVAMSVVLGWSWYYIEPPTFPPGCSVPAKPSHPLCQLDGSAPLKEWTIGPRFFSPAECQEGL
jgi:hypothetical protein